MSILDMPSLENIESMTRRDITLALSFYKSPNKATELRLKMALRKGRTVKSLVKWLGHVDRNSHNTSFSMVRDNEMVAIGDDVDFIKRRSERGGFHFSQCKGQLFNVFDNSFIVAVGGKLERVNYE